MIKYIQQFIYSYGIYKHSGFLFNLFNLIIVHITGYNHDKYWSRRLYVLDASKKNIIKKLYYIYYLKKVDAKHLSFSGFSLNGGSQFVTPPLLPHGFNRIIVGHDAKIGANVVFYQGVTISHGGCIIGDNVTLGANCVILPNVCIGNNAKIGANCVVVEDIPDGATCVLNKPRIIIKK